MERTTEISKLWRFPESFTWGHVERIWVIGAYTIASFHPWKVIGCSIQTGEPQMGLLHYHVWIDGKDCSESFDSLESAMAGAVAYAIEGAGHRADFYFMAALRDVMVGRVVFTK